MTHTEEELNREKTTSICLILQSHRCTVHQYTAPCLAFSSGHTDTLSMQMFQSETSLHLQQRGWIWTFYCYCLHLSLIVKAHTISRKHKRALENMTLSLASICPSVGPAHVLLQRWNMRHRCSPQFQTIISCSNLPLHLQRSSIYSKPQLQYRKRLIFFFYNRLRITMMTHQMLMAVMWRILIHFLNDI